MKKQREQRNEDKWRQPCRQRQLLWTLQHTGKLLDNTAMPMTG